jgi:hypothetical protein
MSRGAAPSPGDGLTRKGGGIDAQNSRVANLRTILNGQSRFAGSVGGSDSTSVLLDPQMFPTGFLYVVAIPTDGRGRAVAGPLSAGRGDKIEFTIEPALDQSHAIVVR